MSSRQLVSALIAQDPLWVSECPLPCVLWQVNSPLHPGMAVFARANDAYSEAIGASWKQVYGRDAERLVLESQDVILSKPLVEGKSVEGRVKRLPGSSEESESGYAVTSWPVGTNHVCTVFRADPPPVSEENPAHAKVVRMRNDIQSMRDQIMTLRMRVKTPAPEDLTPIPERFDLFKTYRSTLEMVVWGVLWMGLGAATSSLYSLRPELGILVGLVGAVLTWLLGTRR